ncbi:transposable element Tcb1 transposase [Trichonephila clavipes]|nr:transposable element Tcb1 transposase [Trichonephila clavipes]
MENRKETTIEERKLVIKLSNEGRSVSAETVRRVLRKAGYTGRVARKKPLIGKRNRVKRLKFAKEHILKPQKFWNEVIFSDECKFNIFGSDGRKPNTSHHPKHTTPTVKHGVSRLKCYRESVWSHLERAVQKHQITSKEQLKSILQGEWLNIAPETTRHLVELMPRRLEAVISAKVDTSYWVSKYEVIKREFSGKKNAKRRNQKKQIVDKTCIKGSFQKLEQYERTMVSKSSGLQTVFRGRVSLVVKVSDRGWLVTSSSPVPLMTRRESSNVLPLVW